MSNGNFTVQGQQTNLPLGQVNIGPLIAQCSPVSEIIAIPLASGSSTTTVPSASTGAILTCPATGISTTIQWGSTTAALNYVNPSAFSIWQFDPSNHPSSIVVTTTGTATTYSTLQFF